MLDLGFSKPLPSGETHLEYKTMRPEVTSAEQNLLNLGIVLPVPATPLANYVPAVRSGQLLFISGQLAFGLNGQIERTYLGLLGTEVSIEHGQAAARLCAIQILAQVKSALGSLDQVRRCVRLTGYVASAPGFTSIPGVINGASDLMVAVFGDKGRHVRSAVGAAQLPLNCCVEIEAIFEVE